MKIVSEFIVLHEDGPMPKEDDFCPEFWQAEDFDSDGDYYYDGINGRWTMLELTKRVEGGHNAVLEVNTFREKRNYDPGVQEVADLERYLRYRAEGRYDRIPALSAIESPCVTSLRLATHTLADYHHFLDTVHRFLVHTGGVLVNYGDLGAAEFRDEFLAC